jgi:uncharacterized membrane protein YgcG
MEQHENPESFSPDQHHGSPLQVGAISPARRRWRAPAVATSMAVVAGICLYTGSAAHATAKPAAVKPWPAVAKVSAFSAQAAAQTETTGQGGVHGAFNLYDGAGGGLEFWFDPSTGSLTVAVGTGVGALGGGVLGTYAYGTAPAAGTYLYADATLSAGTVVSVNLAGTYQLVNGVFIGSVSATVEGRTLTITSDGSSTFKASVTVVSGASEWSGFVNYTYGYNYYFPDIEEYIWEPLLISDPDDYSLLDNDADGTSTTAYSDADGTDDSEATGSSSDDSGDSGDSGDSDSGGDSGGGGGGSGDDSDAPVMEESFSHAFLPDSASTTSDTSATAHAAAGGR